MSFKPFIRYSAVMLTSTSMRQAITEECPRTSIEAMNIVLLQKNSLVDKHA